MTAASQHRRSPRHSILVAILYDNGATTSIRYGRRGEKEDEENEGSHAPSFQIIHANEGNIMFHFEAKNAIMVKEFDDKNLYIRRGAILIEYLLFCCFHRHTHKDIEREGVECNGIP